MGKYVITGIGQVSSLGKNVEEMKENLIKEKTNFSYENGVYARILDFDFYCEGFTTKTYLDKAIKMTLISIKEAYCDIKNKIENNKIGLITASNFGCLNSTEMYLNQLNTLSKKKFASPIYFVNSICNMINSFPSIEFKFKGFSNHLFGTSDSALFAFWHGIKMLEKGVLNAVVIGGVDVISDKLIKGLKELKLINESKDEKEIRGVLDKDRKNPIWGEGAAFCVIQNKNQMKAGEKIFAEILGLGYCAEKNKISRLEKAMKMAVKKSNISESEVSFIISNTNGSKNYDLIESSAIFEVFGEETPVFSPKMYFGETSAAAGILGMIVPIALKDELIPTNKYLYNKDEKIKINLSYKSFILKENMIYLINGYGRNGMAVSICLKLT